MVRVEKNPEPMLSKQDMKKEVKRQVVWQHNKRRLRRLGCVGIFLFVLFLCFLFVMWFLAQTGFVNVPVLSKFYNPPEPAHYVEPGQLVDEYAADVFLDKLESVAYNLSLDNHIQLELSEGILTSGIQEQISNLDSDIFLTNDTQVVIDPNFGMELFLPLKYNDDQAVVILYVTPVLVDKSINIEVNRIQIGNINLPQSMAEIILETPIKTLVEQLNSTFTQFINIESIDVQNGVLIIDGYLSLDFNF